MNIITRETPSRYRLKPASKAPTDIQVHKFCENDSASLDMNSRPANSATRNERPIEPAPTIAAGTSGNLPAVRVRIRKPIRGMVGTNHNMSNISLLSLTLHLAQDVKIQSLVATEQLQHQAKSNCHFGGSETDNHQEHNLAVSLAPA